MATASTKPRYLWRLAFLTLEKVADVVIEGGREAVPADEVATNVDRYLADLRARNKWVLQVGLVLLCIWPLFSLRPPLPLMPHGWRRRYLEKHFVDHVPSWRFLRATTRAMIRMSSQLAYLGYYGDRRSWESIRYQPFHERRPDVAQHAPRHHASLQTLAGPPGTSQLSYDTLVIGSGAAGSILAYRSAAAGRRVLLLERGPYVDPRDFGENEARQYLRLYNEGALQLTKDFSLQVLQGMCVGGGTTVNNALCFQPPASVLDEWGKHDIDRNDLEASIRGVHEMLRVTPVRERTASKAARRFEKAARDLEDRERTGHVWPMEANISDACVGCGYCNIGCAYGAKMSMLDWVLPWAQKEYEGRLDILADFEVANVVYKGDKALGVCGTYSPTDERVFIPAWEEVFVAAGAIHSSWILRKSGIATDNVGKGVHFTFGSPLTAEFEDDVDAFDGVQMSHAYHPSESVTQGERPYPQGRPAFLLETWFNPPATQAVSMPGWFREHFENMRRYRNMASVGIVVGTTSPSEIVSSFGAPVIDFNASRADMHRLIKGLTHTAKIFLEAGATRVMPTTYASIELRKGSDFSALNRYIKDSTDILLSTAHPQGGNPVGDPKNGGVVDDHFRVHGFKNLYVCDASVFPTGVHVQPQLTVMGMADYAANRILGPATASRLPLLPAGSGRA